MVCGNIYGSKGVSEIRQPKLSRKSSIEICALTDTALMILKFLSFVICFFALSEAHCYGSDAKAFSPIRRPFPFYFPFLDTL